MCRFRCKASTGCRRPIVVGPGPAAGCFIALVRLCGRLISVTRHDRIHCLARCGSCVKLVRTLLEGEGDALVSDRMVLRPATYTAPRVG